MRFISRLLVLFVITSPALAQTASLRGQVTDQNGAVRSRCYGHAKRASPAQSRP